MDNTVNQHFYTLQWDSLSILVIICYHANLSQCYWLFPFTFFTHPVIPSCLTTVPLVTVCFWFFGKISIKYFAQFKIELLVLFSCNTGLHILIKVLIRHMICQYFCLIYSLSFRCFNGIFWSTNIFKFNEVKLISFFLFSFKGQAFGRVAKKSLPNPKLERFFSQKFYFIFPPLLFWGLSITCGVWV